MHRGTPPRRRNQGFTKVKFESEKSKMETQNVVTAKVNLTTPTSATTLGLLVSFVCSAFKEQTIGTKVLKEAEFLTQLASAINRHDTSKDPVAGQHVIVLPPEMYELVSAGDGPRSQIPSHYVLREHRGAVGHYLRRKYAGKVTSLTAIVYTQDAYISDPQLPSEELMEVRKWNPSHVVVAVLASAGPTAPYSAERFVANLAGGNKEALLWSADEIREKAAAIVEHYKCWSIVAD